MMIMKDGHACVDDNAAIAVSSTVAFTVTVTIMIIIYSFTITVMVTFPMKASQMFSQMEVALAKSFHMSYKTVRYIAFALSVSVVQDESGESEKM